MHTTCQLHVLKYVVNTTWYPRGCPLSFTMWKMPPVCHVLATYHKTRGEYHVVSHGIISYHIHTTYHKHTTWLPRGCYVACTLGCMCVCICVFLSGTMVQFEHSSICMCVCVCFFYLVQWYNSKHCSICMCVCVCVCVVFIRYNGTIRTLCYHPVQWYNSNTVVYVCVYVYVWLFIRYNGTILIL